MSRESTCKQDRRVTPFLPLVSSRRPRSRSTPKRCSNLGQSGCCLGSCTAIHHGHLQRPGLLLLVFLSSCSPPCQAPKIDVQARATRGKAGSAAFLFLLACCALSSPQYFQSPLPVWVSSSSCEPWAVSVLQASGPVPSVQSSEDKISCCPAFTDLHEMSCSFQQASARCCCELARRSLGNRQSVEPDRQQKVGLLPEDEGQGSTSG